MQNFSLKPLRTVSLIPKEEEFLQAATVACVSWNLNPAEIEVLSHTENVVCRIKLSPTEQVVMRLHRPGYNDLAELNSEVQWVESLANAGLPVPTALPTETGDYYCSVNIGDVAKNEERFVGLIEWVDGAPLGTPLANTSQDVVPHFKTIGALAARIRCHSNQWDHPEGFKRRRWDIDGLLGDTPLWGRFWEAEPLTYKQKMLFGDAREVLRDRLSLLSTGSDRFGLIHADLHLGNIMRDNHDLTIIDFDDAGHGWFAHEAAVALHPGIGEPWFSRAREAFLEGYCSIYEMDNEEIDSIDTFLVVRSLMIVGWLDARPELPAYEYFPTVIEAAEQAVENLILDL
mgnify:FL=1